MTFQRQLRLPGFLLAACLAVGFSRPVRAGTPSPRPGALDSSFDRPLGQFTWINQLLPLPDGRILVATDSVLGWTERHAVIGRLLADGSPDPTFGEGGMIFGNGRAAGLTLMPDGKVLAVGRFTELGGSPATGIAEIDERGLRTQTVFPEFDPPDLWSSVLLGDGRLAIAGTFERVGGVSASKLVRLRQDLTRDESFVSPIEPWELVNLVAVDKRGRLLVTGAWIDGNSPIPGTSPLGVRRLLENGEVDPGFQRFVGGVRTLIVEPEGTLLVGNPPIRLDEDGGMKVRFERPGGTPHDEPHLSPYRWVQLPDGQVVGHVHLLFGTAHQLVRWKPDGRWDTNFSCIVGLQRFESGVQSVALLPDASVILSTASTSMTTPPDWDRLYRLRRVAPDSDRALMNPLVTGAQFSSELATQPERTYRIRIRSTIAAPPIAPDTILHGDGLIQSIHVPMTSPSSFLELVREN